MMTVGGVSSTIVLLVALAVPGQEKPLNETGDIGVLGGQGALVPGVAAAVATIIFYLWRRTSASKRR